VRAAVLEKYGQSLEFADVEVGSVGPEEVLIKVEASGVCHTDRTAQQGAWPSMYLPLVLGHEAAGVVVEAGKAVKGLKPGDKVVTCASASCGECEWCMKGMPHHCIHRAHERPADEAPRLSAGGSKVDAYCSLGGFASEMLVHERAVVKIPDEMPFDKASLLGCAVVTGMGVVRYRAQVQLGDTVAVVGCGGVGLNVVQGARIAGAERIIAVDLDPEKLEMARLFGATDLVDAGAGDAVEQVRDLTGGEGVDHAIEVIGRPQTIRQSFDMLRKVGTATVVGVTRPEDEVAIPTNELLMFEKRLQGSRSGTARFRLDIPLYCRLYLDGRLKLDELVSKLIPLEEVNEALEALDGSSGLRRIITFD
jgi:S-(hydroxymethyl)glutathione dehydrogenase / alcohol dehydrogenase